MFWTIFLFVLIGMLVHLLVNVKKFDSATPNPIGSFLLSKWFVLQSYFEVNFWELVWSVIMVFVFTYWLNDSLASWLIENVLKIPIKIDDSNVGQIKFIAFAIGFLSDWVIISIGEIKNPTITSNTLDLKK